MYDRNASFNAKGTKGQSREYRKACRKLGLRGFPLKGAFHVTLNGNPVTPSEMLDPTNVNATGNVKYVQGPLPEIINVYVPEAPPVIPDTRPTPPAMPEMETCYKRTVREADPLKPKSKRRIDYKPVKNPKSGEMYYVKRLVEGKMKYIELSYASIFQTEPLAA